MKYKNNLLNICTTVIPAVFIIIILFSYSNHDEFLNYEAAITNNPKEHLNMLSSGIYNGEWKLISKLSYVKGTIVSLKQSSEGKYILNLKVECNYHSKADSVNSLDYPFKEGYISEFVLKDEPKINFNINDNIIIYQGQFTTKNNNDFYGANIKYYEKKGKFTDLDGNKINLPLQDFPDDL